MSAAIVAKKLTIRLYIFDHNEVGRELQTILLRHMTMGVPNLAVAPTHLLTRFSLELVLCITLDHIVDKLTKSVISHGIRMSLQVLLSLKPNLISFLELIGCWLISDFQFAVHDEAYWKTLKTFPSPRTSIGAIWHLDRCLSNIDGWIILLIW